MHTSSVKVLFVQGSGDRESPAALLEQWISEWRQAIEDGSREAGRPMEGRCRALLTKPLWDLADEPDERTYGRLLQEVNAKIAQRAGNALRPEGTREGASVEQMHEIQRLAQWISHGRLRARLRQEFCALAAAFQPEAVVAHGIGSLIVYEALLFEQPNLMKDAVWVTLGSPLAHPLVRNVLGGGLPPVPVRYWFNLFNPTDVLLAAPVRVRFRGFSEVRCEHEQGHDALGYLSQAGAHAVWRCLSDPTEIDRMRQLRSFDRRATQAPAKRALLIGIDRYQDPRIGDLDGCRNDTYLLSAALQECGFEPEQIRLLHNERATRREVMERLEWLLDDCRAGDMRVLAFSGHGHQLAGYDVKGEPDCLNECLAPHDYAFSEDTAIMDRELCELYADLPAEAFFLLILDCCHSGGMERDVAAPIRGLSSPDDIAHRELRWDPFDRMWVPRELPKVNRAFGGSEARRRASRNLPDHPSDKEAYFGASGSKRRLGRASWMRELDSRHYDALQGAIGAVSGRGTGEVPVRGAHLPMIYMACREDQVAREYAHGAVKYGAFTYALVQSLEDVSTLGLRCTFNDLLYYTTVKLIRMGFDQCPSFLGPSHKRRADVPIEPRIAAGEEPSAAGTAPRVEALRPARQQAIITIVMALWETGAIAADARDRIKHAPAGWTEALLGTSIDELQLNNVEPDQPAASVHRNFARYLDDLCAYRGVAGRPGFTRAGSRRSRLLEGLQTKGATVHDVVRALEEVYDFEPG